VLSLGGESAPAVMTVRAWLVAQLSALALPFDAARLATWLPAVGLLVVGSAASMLGLAGVGGSAVVAVVLVVALRRGAPRRRVVATERALPGVLDAVARQLRAGGSLSQAIAAARPPAASPDLRAQWERLNALVPVVGATAALEDWSSSSATASSLDSRSVRLAGAALALASTTGGSPARAIDGVAATLRSRLAVSDEIRALSSQARASAVVIALSPLVFGVLGGASDSRSRAFLASPAGSTLLVLGLALDAIGGWWMARLCRAPSVP
jgi:tight adherence protein B